MSSIYFNDEHEAFRQLVRKFVETEINPHIEEWEAAGQFPAHPVQKNGQSGTVGPHLS
jgi:alkylation response protein AidB-like acyl-CoA dehydrogenase